MSKLVKALAAKISLEDKVEFSMKQSLDFKSKVIGVSVEEARMLTEDEMKKQLTDKMKIVSPEDLFSLITPDMMKKKL